MIENGFCGLRFQKSEIPVPCKGYLICIRVEEDYKVYFLSLFLTGISFMCILRRRKYCKKYTGFQAETFHLDYMWPMTLQFWETTRESMAMGQNADMCFLDLEARHFLWSCHNKCGHKTHYLEWGISVIHEYHG